MDPSEQEEALDMGKKPPLSDFQTGPDDGECRTISYKITPEGPESLRQLPSDSVRVNGHQLFLPRPS